LPPPEQLLPPTTPAPPEALPGETPDTITVDRFTVTGSTVFSEADFTAVLQPFTGRPISLTELFQARAAITQLYTENGYITSGAFIPPQKFEGGVIEIRVVEGGLEDIRVSGLRRLNPNYVRSRIAIATRRPLNRERLLEALQLLQLDPLIQTISAELSTGSRPGESLLDVRVTEGKTFSAQLLLDNGRSPSVGTDRRQIQLTQANLTGLGDTLSFAYTNTNGSNSFDFNYSIPFNPRNGTISFSFETAHSSVIEDPFTPLDIESDSRFFETTIRQPIVQSPTREIALGATLTLRYSNSVLFGGDIPFPALGADEEGTTRLTALRFFQDATWRTSRSVVALRSQFSVGLNAFNSNINADPPDSRFFAWRGQAQWVRLLAPDTLFLLRGDLQLADRPLLPFEQFAIGGLDSVRGYRQDLLLSDNGFFASAEFRIPILRLPRINTLLQLATFAEIGTGWNRGDRPDPDPQTLAAVGLGLRLQLSDRLSARFDWGIPLTSISGNKDSFQEQGLYFSIIANLF
jgi:hemolysin activation/secretion protein